MDLLNEANMSIQNLINLSIKNTLVIDFGYITELINDSVDIVKVNVGACLNAKDFISFNCILCSAGSANMTTKIDPKVGDKVIVFYPRRYDPQMLNPKNDKVAMGTDCAGYSYGKCLGFLASQFFNNEETQKNLLHVTNETIDFATDKQLTLNITNDNPATVNINNASVSIDKDGNIDISSADSKTVTVNGAKFTVSNGNVDISATKITINGTSLEVS